MKDPIDRWLEKNSAMFMPDEEEDERVVPSPSANKPEKPKPSDQERWDNSMKAMGWTHLVGMKKEEDVWVVATKPLLGKVNKPYRQKG